MLVDFGQLVLYLDSFGLFGLTFCFVVLLVMCTREVCVGRFLGEIYISCMWVQCYCYAYAGKLLIFCKLKKVQKYEFYCSQD